MVSLAPLPEQEAPQVMGPTSFKKKVEPTFWSIADGDDEDLVGVDKSQLGQPQSSLSLEDHVLEMARRVPGAGHRAAQKHMVHGEYPAPPQGFLYSTQHLVHHVRDYWRNLRVTMLCIARTNNSRMLLKDINGWLLNRLKLLLLLLRIVQQRK